MPEDFIKFAFSAGVLAPRLHGRSDVEKFDLGLKDANNFFIDYRGGATTRPGLYFLDYTDVDDKAMRLVSFRFNSALANNYALLFGDQYLRFLQDGAYVLEADITITGVTTASPAVVTTSGSHSYSNGDWVQFSSVGGIPELSNQTLVVANVTATTFEVQWPDGTDFSTVGSTYTSGGVVNRVYTVTTPYVAADLFTLRFDQFRDELRIVGTGYAPRKLTRAAATSWTLAEIDFDGNTDGPANLAYDLGGSTGGAGLSYAVTAVNSNGDESIIGSFVVATGVENLLTSTGTIELTWDAVTGAREYRIYRSLFIVDDDDASLADDLGYLGKSKAPRFIDNGIIPDFTTQPPSVNDPFANGAVIHIDMTAGGAGYSRDGSATVSVSGGGGSGFSGEPIVTNAGDIIGVIILNPGSGYSASPTVSFGGGSGATGTAEVTQQSGNYPQALAPLQQRQVYGGTTNQPNTIFGSRPGSRDNFMTSDLGTAADSFELDVDDPELDPIKFLHTVPNGLFVFTEGAVWLVRGADDSIISGNTSKAEPEHQGGIGDVRPLAIANEVLYLESNSTGVKALQPNAIRTFYQPVDRSVYSSHYFTEQNPIVDWAYAKDPYRIVWAVREDGTLLSFTYVSDQNVYAWTPHSTKGFVESVAAVREGSEDKVYAIVRRTVNGSERRYVEQLSTGDFATVEDIFGVDSGLETALTFPAASMTVSAASGSITVTAGSSVFVSGDVGKYFRAGGGRGIVTAYTSGTEITVDLQMPITERFPETSDPPSFASGEWSLTATFTTVSGLDHLEGETVEVFADGNHVDDATVSGGQITLAKAASKVAVGLNYSAHVITLPLFASNVVIENKPKSITAAAVRLLNSRGVEIGNEETDLYYPMKERTSEDYDEPTRFQTGVKEQHVTSGWSEDGTLTVRKSGPLTITLLGLVLEAEIGDD